MTETRMERNRRARAYSRACRIRRLRNALWVVATVLAVLLAAELIWLFSSMPASGSDTSEAALPQETAILLEPAVTETVGVFTVTGYCACCTPYSHLNRRGDLVLTASGEGEIDRYQRHKFAECNAKAEKARLRGRGR